MKYEYKKEYWDNTATDLETKLNAMGSDGWDCFHIEGAHFYFKREKAEPSIVYEVENDNRGLSNAQFAMQMKMDAMIQRERELMGTDWLKNGRNIDARQETEDTRESLNVPKEFTATNKPTKHPKK